MWYFVKFLIFPKLKISRPNDVILIIRNKVRNKLK